MVSKVTMQMSMLKVARNSISSFLQYEYSDNIISEPNQKYYNEVGEMLMLLKPILDAAVDSAVVKEENLNKIFEELSKCVSELQELFENWQPLLSKVYSVLQVESLLSKVQIYSLDILEALKSSYQCLPDELNSVSQERIKNSALVQISSVIREAIRDQMEGIGPSSEVMARISESVSLRSNLEILIEAVALEKVKENAEQAEKTGEAEYIDQLIALVTRMHDHLVMIKQSQSYSLIPIPADFCCPLSLELMTDPVIVASGQTYERACIRNWLDLGLTVCPKTRKTLAVANLIPNYTVKALIANWCESNNIKLPDRIRLLSLNHSCFLTQANSDVIKDSHVFPDSKGSQMNSHDSVHAVGSLRGNMNSSIRHHGEETSPLHQSSTSGGSSCVTGNGRSLHLGIVSPTSSEDGSANSGERNQDSVGHYSESPARRNGFAGVKHGFSQAHNRTASDSDSISNLGEASGSPNVSNHLRSYSSDPSGEVKSDLRAASNMASLLGGPKLYSRLVTRTRNQTIWRRPSERFVPRIVSSPTAEARADLSAVEVKVRKLVEDLESPSIEIQREATAELRLLAKHNLDNRIIVANCGAISLLVDLLRSPDLKTQENAVTALLNLSINDNNKSVIANADAIEPVIHVLETGSPEAKENSAATLFSLSVVGENKIRIGRSGAIGPLVNLLKNGTPRGKRDAATALFSLSVHPENKDRIVQAGAIKHLVELMDPAAGMVDKPIAVLSNLATIHEGRTAIGQEGGIPVLVEVVELGSPRGKENAAAALLQLCTNSSRYCTMVLQEGAVPPLVALSQSGTPRAREKAQALLSYFRSHRHSNGGRG